MAKYAAAVVVRATLNTGRLTTDGVNSFVRRSSKLEPIGETNLRLVSSGDKPEDWSLLLAAASDRATIRRIPKGSGQGSRITATIVVYSVPSSTARNVAPCPSHANPHSVLRGQLGLFSTDSGVNGALWRNSSPLAIVTGHSEERSDSCCTKIAAFDGFSAPWIS